MQLNRASDIYLLACVPVAVAAGILAGLAPSDGQATALAAIAVAVIGLAAFVLLKRRASFISRFDQVFYDAPAGMMLLDLAGEVTWSNRALQSLFGDPDQPLTGQPFRDLLTGEGWTRLQADRERLLSGGRLDLEGKLRTRAGQTFWTRGYATLLRNDQGRPEHILVQILDQSAAHDASTAAIRTEEQFLATLDLTSDLILDLDARGRIR
ncbi:MAG: PAS domain S-box protein [Pseudomonadales bacterium]|nr:PAS domain S-box protein [Pseudomonadales bacterium]